MGCNQKKCKMVRDSKGKSLLCAHAALNKKASNLVVLEIKELTSFTDYFIVCSGRSDRQVQGIAYAIEESMKKEGIYPLGIEGFSEAKWILLDYNDVIVHVFYEPIRDFYDLESLWAEAPRVEVDVA